MSVFLDPRSWAECVKPFEITYVRMDRPVSARPSISIRRIRHEGVGA